ncbi:caspase family protein [Candidatus Nitrospira bockiana]
MRRVALLTVISACLSLAVSSAHAQIGKPEGLYYKSWAVVIGINDYLVAPKLDNAKANAKAVAEALRKVGFEEIIELYDKDASFKRLNAIFSDFLPRKVGRQDRVVIYFAGHAGLTQDMNGKDLGYLVPWDAQVQNVTKAITLDQLKEFSRRVMSKHVLFLLDTAVSGWDVTPPQQLSLEGRVAPEAETEKRAIQVLTAAGKGEVVSRKESPDAFVQAVVSGLDGAADADRNGWLMATELAEYVGAQVPKATGGAQHPQFARLDGEGDMILIEGKKSAFKPGRLPKTEAERTAAARDEYEEAFTILQQQRPVGEALEHLNRALEYNPSYGDAYVLKSYLYLEYAPNLEEALAAARAAVKYAPGNPDSAYTLGLVLQRKGQFADAEKALHQALAVNPNYADVYLSLGDLYAEDLKDKAKAVEAYRHYLETGGTEGRARAYLEQNGAVAPATKQ